MRILACGSREWSSRTLIFQVLSKCEELLGEFALIHGACRGADLIAGGVARDLEIVATSVPAKWKKYGNRAGPIRNRYMLQQGKLKLVLAFHDDIEESRGTKDCLEQARGMKIPVIVVTSSTSLSQFTKELLSLQL